MSTIAYSNSSASRPAGQQDSRPSYQGAQFAPVNVPSWKLDFTNAKTFQFLDALTEEPEWADCPDLSAWSFAAGTPPRQFSTTSKSLWPEIGQELDSDQVFTWAMCQGQPESQATGKKVRRRIKRRRKRRLPKNPTSSYESDIKILSAINDEKAAQKPSLHRHNAQRRKPPDPALGDASSGNLHAPWHYTDDAAMLDSHGEIPPTSLLSFEVYPFQKESRTESGSTTPATSGSTKRSPQTAQWVTLWRLRHDLRQLYNSLMQATDVADFPRARKVRRLYKDATHMLQVGLSTFLGVLDGAVPTTLQKVLAFACVSKIMWDAVCRKKQDQDVASHNPLDGLSVWRSAIQDLQDRTAFDHIAQALWDVTISPSVNEGVAKNVQQTETATGADASMTPLTEDDFSTWCSPLFPFPELDQSHDNPELAQACLFNSNSIYPASSMTAESDALSDFFQSGVDMLLSETAAHDDIRFADFLNIPGLEEALSSSGAVHYPGLGGESGATTADQAYGHPCEGILAGSGQHELGPEIGASQASDPLWPGNPFNHGRLDVASTSPLDSSDTMSGGGRPRPPGSGETSSQISHGHSPATTLLTCLIGTVLFQAVVAFLTSERLPIASHKSSTTNALYPVLSEPGSVLHIMSGCTISKPPDGGQTSYENPTTMVGEFFTELTNQVIEPLRSSFTGQYAQFLGLLGMAESLVRSGSIRTLRDFEDYLIHVGLVQFPFHIFENTSILTY